MTGGNKKRYNYFSNSLAGLLVHFRQNILKFDKIDIT